MNRNEVIKKIQAILKLQNNTTFEGEAQNAARLIDKLCREYNISFDEATQVQVLDEEVLSYKRINTALATILNAVARFYDAKAYIQNNADLKYLRLIGSEAQQIQTRIYYEFIVEQMEKECDKAYKAEKILSELTGSSVNRGFKTQFRKAFAAQVDSRLREMKEEKHEHAEAVSNKLATMRMGTAKRFTSAQGSGAFAGTSVGSSVSLNRQTSGSTRMALTGV